MLEYNKTHFVFSTTQFYPFHCDQWQINIRETRMGNQEYEQSRDTGNIGHTRHKTKTNKRQHKTTHNKTLKTKKIGNTIKLVLFEEIPFFFPLHMDFIMHICMSLNKMYICIIMVSFCLFVRRKHVAHILVTNFLQTLQGYWLVI